ncbi:MAG: right-handed parallel beta-helix repeat-containing protein, partial [Candidatus Krumholzibacteria bacterium]|nr:right-handed parallel beta-helix repeat-containing protein [Candidatus Krumholzibacteria bacterium]
QNGIQLNGDCYAGGDGIISGAIIEDNFVHDNGWKGFSLISVTGALIQNNIVANNGTRGAGAGGIHLADEPGCDNPSNDNLVVNNTVVEPVIAGIRMTNNSTNNTIFNNLAIASSTDRTIIDEAGGNAIDSGSNLRFASTSGLFVDDANNDFHVSASSPAIGAGISAYNGKNAPSKDFEGTPRPSGASYEVGADEYGGGGGGGPPRRWRFRIPSTGPLSREPS